MRQKFFRASWIPRPVWMLLALAVAVGACDSPTDRDDPLTLEERLDAAFAPPSMAEIAAIRAEWAARDPHAENVQQVGTFEMRFDGYTSDARIYRHSVDGNVHVGLVMIPRVASPASLPVLVYGHPGDGGLNLIEMTLLDAILGPRADEFVIVAPTFRSEPLIIGSQRFFSTGEPSPWDRDVDDALALLEVALSEVAEADETRIYVSGFSRGAGVALLMGIRDPRIRGVIEVAGPTDFTSEYVRDIVEEALADSLRALPGLNDLDRELIQPFARGEISVQRLRAELLRRSPVFFVDDLPPLQVHHGEADDIVVPEQAVALRTALRQVNRDDEVFLYPGVGHLPFGMFALPGRVQDWFDRRLGPAGLLSGERGGR